MGTKIFGLQPSQEDLWDKASGQGYVYIKSESGYITRDEVREREIKSFWYGIILSQRNYGKTWALTKEELQ